MNVFKSAQNALIQILKSSTTPPGEMIVNTFVGSVKKKESTVMVGRSFSQQINDVFDNYWKARKNGRKRLQRMCRSKTPFNLIHWTFHHDGTPGKNIKPNIIPWTTERLAGNRWILNYKLKENSSTYYFINFEDICWEQLRRDL